MIASVCDEAFAPYGDVLEGYDTQELCRRLQRRATGEGVRYQASLPGAGGFTTANGFGGPGLRRNADSDRRVRGPQHAPELSGISSMQRNQHRRGRFYFAGGASGGNTERRLDTGKVRAFRVPAGMAVRLYATTLHYAPCHQRGEAGFCVAIVLPRGTNAEKPAICPETLEDRWLWGRNKWLLAHPDSEEAAQGAYVGLDGINWDVREMG